MQALSPICELLTRRCSSDLRHEENLPAGERERETESKITHDEQFFFKKKKTEIDPFIGLNKSVTNEFLEYVPGVFRPRILVPTP